MDVTTLLLGGAALFLLLKNKADKDSINKKLELYYQDFKDFEQDKINDDKQHDEEEDVINKIKILGFCGIIGNYNTSDAKISAVWWLKFKNVSDTSLTVILESISVTIFNSRQVAYNDQLKKTAITIPPHSETAWEEVFFKENVNMYGYGTIGADLKNRFPNSNTGRYFPAIASIKYKISNPYVNNGLYVEAPLFEKRGLVYGERIFTTSSDLGNGFQAREVKSRYREPADWEFELTEAKEQENNTDRYSDKYAYGGGGEGITPTYNPPSVKSDDPLSGRARYGSV